MSSNAPYGLHFIHIVIIDYMENVQVICDIINMKNAKNISFRCKAYTNFDRNQSEYTIL